ncbi:MAG: uroporphyrinogen decarboxylase family protein [Beijerinckiaceae bacterium]
MTTAESLEQSNARTSYDRRWQRVMDCVALRQPDRMPVTLFGTFWLAKYGGVSHKQLMYDYEGTAAIAERAVLELDPDTVSSLVLQTAMGPTLDAVGYKQLQWPGHGVGDHQPYQYLDREYMKPEEYDDFLFDPTGYYLRVYLPRIMEAFEGFSEFPSLPGGFYFRLFGIVRGFDNPALQQSWQNVLSAAKESQRLADHNLRFISRMAELGYPMANIATSGAPFDVLGDYFRGARGILTDMRRRGDKLLEAADKMRVLLVRQVVPAAKASGNPIVFIPFHWAPDAFMSEQQFCTYWWPSFRQMMLDLIAEDLIPMPMWESDCTKRLEIIKDIPPGKCIYWFERTDMVKAFDVLGDVVALRGNVSPSLLTTGTPVEVDAAVKTLVDNVYNRGGRLILDAAFGLPDETPVANVRAMFAAARKYAG